MPQLSPLSWVFSVFALFGVLFAVSSALFFSHPVSPKVPLRQIGHIPPLKGAREMPWK